MPFPVSLSREVICVCVVLSGSRLWGVRPPVFDLKIVATTAGFDVTTVFSSSTGALSRAVLVQRLVLSLVPLFAFVYIFV